MEYNRTDIRNIAFEYINDRFSKGKYLGIEVTIDMTNGYINGPHLVGQVLTKNGKPKRFDHWRETNEARELLEYLTPAITGVEIIKDVTDAPNGLRGAYIHPRLVPHVAQWASPIFADKVAIIINSKAIEEAIAEKNIEIKSLRETLNEIKQQNDELLNYARKADEDNASMLSELDNVANEAKETNERLTTTEVMLTDVQTKLDIAVERRVPADPVDRRNEIFAIYQKPNLNDYKVIRCQYRSKKASIQRCYDQGYTTQVYCKEDPNAVNIWNRAKVNIHTVAKVTGGYFLNIKNNKTESDLLAFIQSVETEKKNV